jgi:hypothetical protein
MPDIVLSRSVHWENGMEPPLTSLSLHSAHGKFPCSETVASGVVRENKYDIMLDLDVRAVMMLQV